ncbi:MAG: BON domain-containing protein, partial [Thiobacillus sp.]|nr:BON domain-containing protein [Thiobacillus sp.]
MKRALVIAFLILPGWNPPASGQELPAPQATVKAPAIVVQGAPDDAAIRSRLVAVLGAIDGLENVEVEVTSGVVMLTGDVPHSRAAREVIDIAGRTEG